MKNFWCIHEDWLKILIKFINENFLMYSRTFIEDPDKVYECKFFDVFTKIHWTCGISWWLKNSWCIHEDFLKVLIKFMNEKLLIYSRRFIEDPGKVYKWKLSDVFTKIQWRSWMSWWIKNVWSNHKDLLKILIKFMNENFLMYLRRFLEDANQVYKWKFFDVFTKLYWKPWSSL